MDENKKIPIKVSKSSLIMENKFVYYFIKFIYCILSFKIYIYNYQYTERIFFLWFILLNITDDRKYFENVAILKM